MRRFCLWVVMVVLASAGSSQAVSVGIREVGTGALEVTAGPGSTVVLEVFLDTDGLSLEGYYLGIDFTGGPLTIQSVVHEPLPGLFPDLFGVPQIDNVAQTVRDMNQTTFLTPLAAGEYVLDLITIQVGALGSGQTITASPGLFGQALGVGGGACPGLAPVCTVSFASASIVPEPATGLMLAAGLLLLALLRPPQGSPPWLPVS
jgi:hypothetical protein